MKRRYWVRFKLSGTDDYRPLYVPPRPHVLGWWCSGYTDTQSVICAVVELDNISDIDKVLNDLWIGSPNESLVVDFIEEKASNWVPSERFPLSSWMEQLKKDFDNVGSDSETG